MSHHRITKLAFENAGSLQRDIDHACRMVALEIALAEFWSRHSAAVISDERTAANLHYITKHNERTLPSHAWGANGEEMGYETRNVLSLDVAPAAGVGTCERASDLVEQAQG